ncbi:MAG: transglycosylase domain-containing protein [Patescibacteria group bacterium]
MLNKKRKTAVIKTVVIGMAGLIFLAGFFLLWISSWRIPTLDSFEERSVTQSTKIYDRTGEVLLYDVYHNVKRTVVPFAEISPNIKNAILAIEDVDFYKHKGIKISSIIRAISANITGFGFNQGGSTITQQVVKNSLLTNEKQISRKIKEWALAPKIEKILSKDEIFGIYLNEIPFGGSIYGIEEASQAFFGKSSKNATLAEATYLASLPKAPTFYSPYGPNKQSLEERKNLVLSEMLRNGFISEIEHNKAREEKVNFRPQEEFGIKAPHFVMFVREELIKKYGERVLEEGGLRVVTTLDYELQKKAEDAALEQALKNKENFDAENVALVAIDPKSGDILSMVGSRNYFDKEIDGNFNITTAHRQPGSAFKPFAYAQAFIRGYTPDTVIFDLPTEFSTTCAPDGKPLYSSSNCYMPTNYDNKYVGPVSMRQGLAQSRNIPSIKTFYLAGMNETLQLAKSMGIQSLTNIGQYGLTLVLGGGEVSLLDLTSAYGVFANEGVRNPYRAILEVKDRNGQVVEKAEGQPVQVLDRKIAQEISDILSDEQARAPAFGFGSPLYFPGRDVAVKTGTTNDYRDAIIVGYTPDIAIGAWAGNNDNTPMERKIAAFIISPYWNKIMNGVLKKVPDVKFTRPEKETGYDLKPILRGRWQGGQSTLIDKISGKLATEYTPAETLDEILSGGVHSILYWINKEDPRGTASPNRTDPQFGSWEYQLRAWVVANGIGDAPTRRIPTEFDDVHNPDDLPLIIIDSPASNRVYERNSRIDVRFQNDGRYQITKADYFVNDEYIGSAIPPFRFSFLPEDIASIQSGQNKNSLRVVVYDSVSNRGEVSTRFSVLD